MLSCAMAPPRGHEKFKSNIKEGNLPSNKRNMQNYIIGQIKKTNGRRIQSIIIP